MNQSLKRLLLPTPLQTLGCLGVSLLTFIILYRAQIWHRIQVGSLGNDFQQVDYGAGLSNLIASPIIHTAVIVTFWSMVGLLAYTVVWSLVNVAIEARNEVVLETEYTNRGAVWQRLRMPLFQLALGIGLLVFIFFSAKVLVPIWLDLMNTGLSSSSQVTMITSSLGAVLAAATNLYAVLLLGQLVFWIG